VDKKKEAELFANLRRGEGLQFGRKEIPKSACFLKIGISSWPFS